MIERNSGYLAKRVSKNYCSKVLNLSVKATWEGSTIVVKQVLKMTVFEEGTRAIKIFTVDQT